ncbi:tRNA threonylcarbamoyladenosine biosynthesis protein RimN [Coxiella endosymbiont of Amblyomma sculptum]|uniref:Sua5/YciO/YrdC/YwlC family protein n=1 Tax=Coxiella endosymbiont of Amblyomma sculptum TaxID=2487929 RepID=UPI00132EFC41|nr:Sua5/YciO/YrdC/YwlC family protein [Coxiella endosymbiont of Amblyomma sculptum]QHG92386.1 tRNA threonylcarbamoyladenosine biosynthesis protein RimN [Coxiella endosymbiont of Amblyomma sculptum]
MITRSVKEAAEALKRGKVIAYPTEAVYGLGCDPFNFYSVTQLLLLKNRSIKKGFILIASEWKQAEFLIRSLDPKRLSRVFSTWPGPTTWIFPTKSTAPYWIHGCHTTIAIRITAHPLSRLLCSYFGKPIISTSANFEGNSPIQDIKTLEETFGDKIDVILKGPLGSSARPTEIRDAVTGKILRIG